MAHTTQALPPFVAEPDPEIFQSGNGIVLDLETTNTDFGSPHNLTNRIILSCWAPFANGARAGPIKHCWGGENEQHELIAAINAADFLIAHNCFAGDTDILTDKGIKKLSGIADTEQTIWNSDGWQKSVIRSHGRQKLNSVELVPYNRSRSSITRTVQATDNHRWPIERLVEQRRGTPRRYWQKLEVTTEQLCLGDKLYASAPPPAGTDDEGFRHGLIFADGALCSDQPKDFMLKYAHQLRLCGRKEIYKECFRNFTYPKSANGDPVVPRYLSANNCKELPPEYTSNAYKASFIEGWQKLDGTWHANHRSRIIQTARKDAADWLEANAVVGGWVVTGRNEYQHLATLGGTYSNCLLYSITLSRPEDTAWTVKAVVPLEGMHEVFCPEVNGLDEFTLASGIRTKNCKFELGWLRRCGLDLRKVLVYDTMLAEWVLLGNQNHLGLSLEATVERHGVGVKEYLGSLLVHRAAVETTSIPKNWLLDYCRTDVDVTARLAQRQLQLLTKRNQLHLVYQRGLACACLTDIEFNGLRLDKEAVFTEHQKVLREYLETKESLEMYGDVNWRSPKQVTEFLYDTLKFSEPTDRRGNPLRTATGNRSASEEAISSLVPKNEEQRKFVELFRKAANLGSRLSKTLDFFKGVCEHYDSTFYGILNQGSTDSHRLSSNGRAVLLNDEKTGKSKPKKIQFQNIPREYKKLVKAKRPGWKVLEADFAQLEFRAAADLGHDDVARAEIEAGADIHSITAERLRAYGEPTSRQDAKSRTFRPLYGGTSGTKAERAYCKFFQDKYHQIYQTQKGWTHEVLRSNRLVTPYGMIFYWHTKVSATGYIDHTTQIFNLPVQGLATGEIVPLSLVCFWHRTKDLELEITNTVHDSIVSEVSEKDAEKAKEVAELSMTSDVYMLLKKLYKYEWTVPLAVEIKIGDHWGADDSK